jgi:type IV pilus assembly protein PilO
MNDLITRIAFLTTKQVGFFSLLLGVGFYFTLFDDGSDMNPQIVQLQNQLTEQQNKKIETEKALAKRDKLAETLANLTVKFENLSRIVPGDLNSFDLNRQIDQLNKTTRIAQVLREPEKVIPGKVIDEWPVRMEFVGAYGDIAQFVYQASTTEKVMLVKGFKITSPDPYDGRLKFEVRIAAYKLARTIQKEEENPKGSNR